MTETYKKLLHLLLLFLTSVAFSQQKNDSLYVVQYSDSVMIWHKNTLRNCCAEYFIDISIEDTIITMIEKNIHTKFCDCLCIFDLSVTLYNLLPGNYTVRIFSDSIEDNIDFGSVSININTTDGTNKQLGKIYYNQFQSECGGITSIEHNLDLPDGFILISNYPNPFNVYTTIQYQLSKREFIDLTIYNLNGKKIETLVHENKGPGIYKIIWHAQELSSGVYLIDLKSKSNHYCKKAIYLK